MVNSFELTKEQEGMSSEYTKSVSMSIEVVDFLHGAFFSAPYIFLYLNYSFDG